VQALAPVLAEQTGSEPRFIGSPGDARQQDWSDDVRESRGCILEAGGQVDDALVAERFPVLLASDCSICMTTLPTVARHFPESYVLWLDAHGATSTRPRRRRAASSAACASPRRAAAGTAA
jgi:arginase family enzyme